MAGFADRQSRIGCARVGGRFVLAAVADSLAQPCGE